MISNFSFPKYIFLAFIISIFKIESSVSQPIEIIVSIPSKPNSINTYAVKKFSEELEKRAPGQFKVIILVAGGDAVTQGKEIPAILEGSIHMGLASAADFFEIFKNYIGKAYFENDKERETYFAALEIQMMPFIFRDHVHMQHILDTLLGPIIISITRKLGIEILGWSYHGTRVLEATYDRPITKPGDIQLGELRVPEGEVWRNVATCLAESEDFKAVPHGEVKNFIKKRSIKVLEFPLASFKVLDVDSYFKQIVLTNHVIHYLYWVFSEEKMSKLSSEQQSAIKDAIKEAIKYNDELRTKEEQNLLEFYRTIFKVQSPDIGAFKIQTEKKFRDKLSSPVFEDLYRKVIAQN